MLYHRLPYKNSYRAVCSALKENTAKSNVILQQCFLSSASMHLLSAGVKGDRGEKGDVGRDGKDGIKGEKGQTMDIA